MVPISKFNKDVKKLIRAEEVTVDGIVFNLHCKITSLMLFFASAVVSMKVYVGDGPIQCLSDFQKKDHHRAVETFCWVTSTFTLPPNRLPGDTAHSINDMHLTNFSYHPGDRIYHAYYQWVCFILFFQAVLFYAPKWFWQHTEGGLMKTLTGTQNEKLLTNEDLKKLKNVLANYFVERLEGHTAYTFTYWMYEFICLVNVLVQAVILNWFFGGDVYTFWYSVHDLYTKDFKFPSSETMDYIFPLRTKCSFSKYGPSGTMEYRDAFCILVLNTYNRYIFFFMWYWFLLLIAMLTLLLVYRGWSIYSARYRNFLLQTPGLKNVAFETRIVAYNLSVSDWWVLYLLKSNINPVLYKSIIRELFLRLSFPGVMLQESRKILSDDESDMIKV